MAGMEGFTSRSGSSLGNSGGGSSQDYGVYRTRSEKYSNPYIEGN